MWIVNQSSWKEVWWIIAKTQSDKTTNQIQGKRRIKRYEWGNFKYNLSWLNSHGGESTYDSWHKRWIEENEWALQ